MKFLFCGPMSKVQSFVVIHSFPSRCCMRASMSAYSTFFCLTQDSAGTKVFVELQKLWSIYTKLSQMRKPHLSWPSRENQVYFACSSGLSAFTKLCSDEGMRASCASNFSSKLERASSALDSGLESHSMLLLADQAGSGLYMNYSNIFAEN